MKKGEFKQKILSFTNDEISRWDKKTALSWTKKAQNIARLQVNNLNRYLQNPNNIRPNIIRENNESQDRKKTKDKVNYLEHKFSLTGSETLNQLKHEFRVARQFISSKTNVIGSYNPKEIDESKKYVGFKGVLGRFAEKLNINFSDLSKENFDKLWDIYNRLARLKENGELDKANNYSSNQLQKDIFDIIVDNENDDIEEILTKAINKLSSVKEKEQEEDEQLSTSLTFGFDTGKKS